MIVSLSLHDSCIVSLLQLCHSLHYIKKYNPRKFQFVINQVPFACNYKVGFFKKAVLHPVYHKTDTNMAQQMNLREITHFHRVILPNKYVDAVDQAVKSSRAFTMISPVIQLISLS